VDEGTRRKLEAGNQTGVEEDTMAGKTSSFPERGDQTRIPRRKGEGREKMDLEKEENRMRGKNCEGWKNRGTETGTNDKSKNVTNIKRKMLRKLQRKKGKG